MWMECDSSSSFLILENFWCLGFLIWTGESEADVFGLLGERDILGVMEGIDSGNESIFSDELPLDVLGERYVLCLLFIGALALLCIPSALVFSAGIFLKESRATYYDYKQGFIGRIYAIRSVGSLLGVLYQIALMHSNFRSMLFWGQVLSSLAGVK